MIALDDIYGPRSAAPPLMPGNFSKMSESRAAIELPEQRHRCLYRPSQRLETPREPSLLPALGSPQRQFGSVYPATHT